MFSQTKKWLRRQHDLHKACVFETVREGWDYSKQLDKKAFLKQVFGRRWLGWWSLLAVVTAVSIVLSVYHDRMVNAIRPFAEKILHTKGAWAVPVAALIIVSIPPLFGHEIIILVVGIIWGLAMGFLIAILGTFLGELLIYYLFKHFFRERAVKIEKASQLYANLAEIMRRDGLWMIALVRFSAVPGHVTTAIQSTIGIGVVVYGIAAAISLPKQLALVYLGVLFGKTHKLPAEIVLHSGLKYDTAATNRQHVIVTWAVFCITGWATVMAFYIIWFRIWQMRKSDAAKKAAALLSMNNDINTSSDSSVAESKDEPSFLEDTTGENHQGYMPSMEYYTTASSGSRTPAPSYRELMLDMSPKTKASTTTLGSVYGRPSIGRSRSSTLASLAFNNNSLPYLPYTPMLEMPNQFMFAPNRMPSPVPTAVVPTSPPIGQDHDLEIQVDGAASSSNTIASIDSENSLRIRRLRLAKSSSNLCLPSNASSNASQDELSELRPVSPLGLGIGDTTAKPRSRSRSNTRPISSLPLEMGITNYGQFHTLRRCASDDEIREIRDYGDEMDAKRNSSAV